MKLLVLIPMALAASSCLGGDHSGLMVQDPWARPAPEVAPTAAFFMTIENESDIDETLVSVTTDACRVTEIHRSTMNDGVMTMQQLVEGLEIPAFEAIALEPGGLHIMCVDKLADFTAGTEIELELEFLSSDGNGRSETVTAVVEDR